MSEAENTAETSVEIVSADVVESLTRGEVDMQVATAKRYPRSIEKFKQACLTLATQDAEVAGSCFYHLPRGKGIEGPSVRLAEIVAASWGNLRAETRIVGASDKFVTAQGACWDMENNVFVRSETQRRITDKSGKRYGDDMIGVTANAAASIAFRNAVFRIVPLAHVKPIYEQCKKVAVGEGRSFIENRNGMLDWFQKLGISQEAVLAKLGCEAVGDLTVGDCLKLRGLATAIHDGETTAEETFRATVPGDGTHGFGKRRGQHEPAKRPGGPAQEPQKNGEPQKQTASEKPKQEGVKAKLKRIRAAKTVDELTRIHAGDERKTVKDAVRLRLEQLNAANAKEDKRPDPPPPLPPEPEDQEPPHNAETGEVEPDPEPKNGRFGF